MSSRGSGWSPGRGRSASAARVVCSCSVLGADIILLMPQSLPSGFVAPTQSSLSPPQGACVTPHSGAWGCGCVCVWGGVLSAWETCAVASWSQRARAELAVRHGALAGAGGGVHRQTMCSSSPPTLSAGVSLPGGGHGGLFQRGHLREQWVWRDDEESGPWKQVRGEATAPGSGRERILFCGIRL